MFARFSKVLVNADLDLGDSDPTGRRVEMPETMDDFTIVLPELIDMATCELKWYDGLDRL
jgi:hypothetical protein